MSLSAHQETCTACAGTMILEMAALSRLTGEFIFEQKAHRAMDGLWKIRHRSSDLMGTVLNVQSGDWVSLFFFIFPRNLLIIVDIKKGFRGERGEGGSKILSSQLN